MSVFDLLRSQNSIEYAPSPLRSVSEGAAGGADRGPELAPALAAAPPGGTMPGAGPALPATAPATTSPANADPPGIQAQYYIENAGKERRYYKDLEGKQLAFRADSKAVTTKQEDRVTVSHVLDVAQARGWNSLHVRGTAAFKQEAWIEAQARGLSVKGYEPTADDRRNVQARRDTRQQPQAATAAEAVPAPNVMANATPTPAPVQAATPVPAAAPVPAPAAASAASQNGAAAPAAEKIAAQAGKATKTLTKAQDGTQATVAVPGSTDTKGADAKGNDAKPDVAAKLSPAGKKALAFLDQKIETQMAKLTDDVKADLRTRAVDAIAKREAEAGPVRIPVAKPARKQAAGRDQAAEAPKRQGKSGEEQKPAQVQQPRVGMG